LCAVIMKSTKEPSELPLSWKLGIDIRKNIETGETTVENLSLNLGEGKAMPGGPTCTFNGKKYLVLLVVVRMLASLLKCWQQCWN
jgi:hypothetical protein